MGTEIIRETFGEQDYARFRERLERCLSDLGELLARLRALPLRVRAPGARDHYVRILPAVLTGRRIVAAG